MAEKETKAQINKSFVEAVKAGDIKQVKEYIAKGADVNVPLPGNESLLSHAIWHEKDNKMFKVLIDAGMHTNVKEHDNGCTPMHMAAMLGNTEAVQMLLDNFADINAEDKNGATPLEDALTEKRRYITKESLSDKQIAAMEKLDKCIELIAKNGGVVIKDGKIGVNLNTILAYTNKPEIIAAIEAGQYYNGSQPKTKNRVDENIKLFGIYDRDGGENRVGMGDGRVQPDELHRFLKHLASEFEEIGEPLKGTLKIPDGKPSIGTDAPGATRGTEPQKQ